MYCHWIGFCGLNPSEQAAWVQAIGTVLTIMVTMFLWQYDLKKRRAGREARAAVARLSLLPPLREWVARLERERVWLSDNEDATGPIVRAQPLPPGHLPKEFVADVGNEGPVLAELVTVAHELFERISKLKERHSFTNNLGLREFDPPSDNETFLNTTAQLTLIHKMLTAQLRKVVDQMHSTLLKGGGRHWDL